MLLYILNTYIEHLSVSYCRNLTYLAVMLQEFNFSGLGISLLTLRHSNFKCDCKKVHLNE